MTQSNPHSVAADASTSALVENADRLGLKWDLRPATVFSIEQDPHHGKDTPDVTVTVDADSVNLRATSMIQDLQVGERVFVIIVPPGGLFICGRSTSLSKYQKRITLTSSQSPVSFVDIPPNLRELELSYAARSDTSAQITEIRMRINNGGAYFTEITQGNAGVTASLLINSSAAQAFIGHVAAATAGGGLMGVGKVWFEGWDMANSTLLAWTFNNGVMASGGVQNVGSGSMTTNVIPSEIDLFPQAGNFIAGSSFWLRGTFS